jgi:hypothetical protein
MSVPEGERKDGKFTLLIKAEELARHTMIITTNEKIFLPEYQRALTDDIITQAKDAYIKIRTANDILVRMGTVYQEEDWQYRRKLQQEAAICCNNLLALIDIAYRLFHLSSKRVKYWGSMAVDVRNRVRAWSQSDASRFSTY